MTCLKIIENIPQHQQNYKLRVNKTKCFNYDAISVIMSNRRCCNIFMGHTVPRSQESNITFDRTQYSIDCNPPLVSYDVYYQMY